jgi:hypothetical protein
MPDQRVQIVGYMLFTGIGDLENELVSRAEQIGSVEFVIPPSYSLDLAYKFNAICKLVMLVSAVILVLGGLWMSKTDKEIKGWLKKGYIMVLKEKVSLKSIIENGNKHYQDRVKFCVDRERRVVAIDSSFHIEMEYELYDDGSNPKDIFGGDIIIDDLSTMKNHIIWEAHPNIEQNRLLGIGYGRPLTDEGIIGELKDILIEWIY